MIEGHQAIASASMTFRAPKDVPEKVLLDVYDRDLKYCAALAKEIYGKEYYVWIELSEGSWYRRVILSTAIITALAAMIEAYPEMKEMYKDMKPYAQELQEKADEYANSVIEHAKKEYSEIGGIFVRKRKSSGSVRVIYDISNIMENAAKIQERGEKITQQQWLNIEGKIQKNLNALERQGVNQDYLTSMYEAIRERAPDNLPENFRQLQPAKLASKSNVQRQVEKRKDKLQIKKRIIAARGVYTD